MTRGIINSFANGESLCFAGVSSSNFPSILRLRWRKKKREKKEKQETKYREREREEKEELFSGRWSNEYGQLDESLESRSSFVLLHMC